MINLLFVFLHCSRERQKTSGKGAESQKQPAKDQLGLGTHDRDIKTHIEELQTVGPSPYLSEDGLKERCSLKIRA